MTVSLQKLVVMCIALCAFSVGNSQIVYAQETPKLTELQAVGKLQIKSWIEPARAIVVNQQVNFVIEVATDRWFSGGTRVGRLEVDAAVVLQREQFALNTTRRQQGATWSVQQWRISIYPQRAGTYEIPALRLTVAVAGDDGKRISGELYSKPVSFEAGVPNALAALTSASEPKADWVASPAFSVAETYSQSHGKELQNLQAGDAVQRTIEFKAENVAAMMLPAVVVTEQAGLATYQKPPRLTDDVNRGRYLALRIETVTYVVEKPGGYVLPELTYYWWDLSRQALQKVVLPQQKISTASAPSSHQTRRASRRIPREWRIVIGIVLTAILFTTLAWVFWRLRRRLRNTNAVANDERLWLKEIVQANQRGDTQQAISLLYRWLDHYQNDRFDGSIRSLLRGMRQRELESLFESMMRREYADRKDSTEVDIERFIRALNAELRRSDRNTLWGVKSVSLELN